MNGVMALDVGSKRIGIAIADPSGSFAIPVGTIERTALRADLERIAEYLESYAIRELVVGEPVTLGGERGIAARRMDEFVAQLRHVFTGAIHRVDERMTTAQATKAMIAAGASRKRRRGAVDMMAAALILETFLARQR
ncbi:MAG TPA: Holliday junction resolvase RuvX [Candidatus Tyrphobacter sp.]